MTSRPILRPAVEYCLAAEDQIRSSRRLVTYADPDHGLDAETIDRLTRQAIANLVAARVELGLNGQVLLEELPS